MTSKPKIFTKGSLSATVSVLIPTPRNILHNNNPFLHSLYFELLYFGFVFQSNFNEKDAFYIFNHVDITIHYHIVEHEQLGARLVAAKIEPKR